LDKGSVVDITVNYQPAPDEVARAFRRGLRSQLNAIYAVTASVLIAGAVVCFAVGDAGLGIALLVASVLGPLAGTWWLRRRVGHQFAFLCVPTTVRITDDGYECRTDASTTMMRWSMFSKVTTTEEFWLLYQSGYPAAFLAKAAFDAAQQTHIDGLLNTRLPA
jgi:small-conductance mechanosensitive channel